MILFYFYVDSNQLVPVSNSIQRYLEKLQIELKQL